ncbi:MAG TPA: fumarylacetoacetate hydrolase family protein [Candidatus Baltobacteraceae bacterium]|jgi:2-keto-4-pentenoate hydratase/2-oxohepta-3-ene-1,7-dioic acid hydratase in catechol pathway
MRYVSYYDDRGDVRPGLLDGQRIREIDAPSLRDYIALAPSERAARHTARARPLDGTRLAPPVEPPRNVFCVGRNYLEHAKEGAAALGIDLKLPSVPTFFTKATTAIAGPGADLHLQARVSPHYDFEAELAVVIGARCKDVDEARALEVVFGYTCLNDMTARDLQRAHGQWFKGKSLDETCPIGPWIVGADEIADPQTLGIAMRVNGVEKQRSTTAQMIFSVARIIAELSRGATLLPGDVIATGTPEGVGFARTPPEWLADGDVLDVTIDRIGTLHNTVRIV